MMNFKQYLIYIYIYIYMLYTKTIFRYQIKKTDAYIDKYKDL